jgi:hypothetical protein
MPPPERKHKFKPEYAKDFVGIKPGKDEFHAHCIACQHEINMTSMGKTAISVHQKKPKHMQNVRASASTKYFFSSLFGIFVNIFWI